MDIDIHALIERAGGVGKLAKTLGVAHPTISGWKKSGFVPGGRVAHISRALDVPADDMLKLVKPTAPSSRAEAEE